MLLQAEQMHKMTSISLKMVEVVILSENQWLSFCQYCFEIFIGKKNRLLLLSTAFLDEIHSKLCFRQMTWQCSFSLHY